MGERKSWRERRPRSVTRSKKKEDKKVQAPYKHACAGPVLTSSGIMHATPAPILYTGPVLMQAKIIIRNASARNAYDEGTGAAPELCRA